MVINREIELNFDAVIKNVKIINGLNEERFAGEVAIRGDFIEAVENPGAFRNARAISVIDGKGCVLAPGFIDIHSHDDMIFWDDAYDMPKLCQGVTTVVTGMCGFSPFPTPSDAALMENIKRENRRRAENYPWTAGTLEEYALQVRALEPAVNLIPVVGHGPLRRAVVGDGNRSPSSDELDAMKRLLNEALSAGSAGMSTGLIYPPGCYADIREITELAGVVSDYKGIYFTHLRSESAGMPAALEEAARICSDANVALHIGHLKLQGRNSWTEAEKRLSYLEKIKRQGLRISWDQYPYTACSTWLTQLLPPGARKDGTRRLVDNLGRSAFQKKMIDEITRNGDDSWENFYSHAGGWDRIMLGQAPGYEELESRPIAELADENGMDPFSFVFRMIQETHGSASMIVFSMDEADVEKILVHPLTCIGSDGASGSGKVHPRMFGTFARVLGYYVREKKLLSLEEAVHKMTFLSAQALRLKDRGAIKKGYKGDIVVFDPDKVKDKATYAEPRQYAEGIIHVFVNGKAVISGGEVQKERAGRVLLSHGTGVRTS